MAIGRLMRAPARISTAAEAAAYDAPYPDARYKAGVRRFPNLVPERPDSDGAACRASGARLLAQRLDRAKRHGDRHGRSGARRAGDARAASRHPQRPPPLEFTEAGHFVQEWGDAVAPGAIAALRLGENAR